MEVRKEKECNDVAELSAIEKSKREMELKKGVKKYDFII